MLKAALVILAWVHGGVMASAATNGRGIQSSGLRGGNLAVLPPTKGRSLQVLVGQVSNVVYYDETVVSAGRLLSNYYEHISCVPSTTRKLLLLSLATILSYPKQ